jgi:hypothetical protein
MRWPMHLDYVEHHPFAINRTSLLGAFVALVGIVLAVYLVIHYQMQSSMYADLKAQQEETQQQQSQPEKKVAQLDMDKHAISTTELAQINSVVTELSLPWDALLTALEQAKLGDVALLSIEPNVKKQQVVLLGEAKNIAAALHYVELLEGLPMLSKVYLQEHEVDLEDSMEPVTFMIVAQWR